MDTENEGVTPDENTVPENNEPVPQNEDTAGNTEVENKSNTMLGNKDEEKDQDKAETKPEDETTDKKEEAGAPEEYAEFEFTTGIEANPEVLNEFKDYAKECNLSQEKAQGLTKMGEKLVKDTYKQQAETWDKVQDEWCKEIENDPEIGGKDLEKNLTACNSVLNQYGDKEFREELSESGFGNNSGLVRMLHRIAKATASDTFVKGDAQQKKTDIYDEMYPNS